MLVVVRESEAVGHVAAMINDRNESYHIHVHSNLRSDRRQTIISHEILVVLREVRRTHSDADEL